MFTYLSIFHSTLYDYRDLVSHSLAHWFARKQCYCHKYVSGTLESHSTNGWYHKPPRMENSTKTKKTTSCECVLCVLYWMLHSYICPPYPKSCYDNFYRAIAIVCAHDHFYLLLYAVMCLERTNERTKPMWNVRQFRKTNIEKRKKLNIAKW